MFFLDLCYAVLAGTTSGAGVPILPTTLERCLGSKHNNTSE